MLEPITVSSLSQLDALVAEKVLKIEVVNQIGYYRYRFINALIPNYSTDMEAAWVIAKKLRLSIKPFPNSKWWVCSDCNDSKESEMVCETAPLAICLVALKSVGVEVELSDED